MKRLRDAASAVSELDEALAFYRDIHPDVADAFFAEIQRAKYLISHFPYAWKNQTANTKGFVLRRHPYTLIYQIRPDAIWLVAYAHHSRRPDYWKARVQPIH